MVDKVTLTSIANLQNETTVVNAINANNSAITTAVDNTLSRDGTSPNQMGAALDMNSNHIMNLPAPVTATEPLRLNDYQTLKGGGNITFTPLPVGGTVNQAATKNSSTDYDISWRTVPVATANDTNVTLSLGGTGTLTAGWTSTLANSRLANMNNNTVKGNVSGGAAAPSDLTTTQLTTQVNPFTSSLSGAVPASGGTTSFLRADATFARAGILNTVTATGGSGNYNPTAGVIAAKVRIVGGGGGGGACTTNVAPQAGGTTSFGTITAAGGSAGVAGTANAGGAGGTGGTGSAAFGTTFRFAGQKGGPALGTGTIGTPGAGGGTSLGQGGPGGVGSAGTAGTAFAGAGGGGGQSTTTAGSGGGGGEYVEFWVLSPTTTSYTVGAGGNGGTAGTQAGGNGAGGILIIEEFSS